MSADVVIPYLNKRFRDEPWNGGDCPRCGRPLPNGYPGALSRYDNETEICSDCGVVEALEIGRFYIRKTWARLEDK